MYSLTKTILCRVYPLLASRVCYTQILPFSRRVSKSAAANLKMQLNFPNTTTSCYSQKETFNFPIPQQVILKTKLLYFQTLSITPDDAFFFILIVNTLQSPSNRLLSHTLLHDFQWISSFQLQDSVITHRELLLYGMVRFSSRCPEHYIN
jgi:hypothetical protein